MRADWFPDFHFARFPDTTDTTGWDSIRQVAAALAHDANNHLQLLLGHASLAQAGLEKSSPAWNDWEAVRAAAGQLRSALARINAITSWLPATEGTPLDWPSVLADVARENPGIEPAVLSSALLSGPPIAWPEAHVRAVLSSIIRQIRATHPGGTPPPLRLESGLSEAGFHWTLVRAPADDHSHQEYATTVQLLLKRHGPEALALHRAGGALGLRSTPDGLDVMVVWPGQSGLRFAANAPHSAPP